MINTNFLYLKDESSHLLVEQWKIQWHGLGPEALYSCQKCRGTWTNLFLLVGSCLLSKRQKDRSDISGHNFSNLTHPPIWSNKILLDRAHY